MTNRLVPILLVAALGCTTHRAVAPALTLPKDTPQVCAGHCDSIGMRLAAVVIISNSEGCVCEPRDANAPAPRAGAAAAGIAPILAAASAAAAAQQQQQQRQQQQGSSSPTPWHPPGQPPIHH